ncbi:uncharacterized protein LOC134036993 [Osmerus eperlanus]|uniref:uncharacterized protein LOC134036993 n=1 Tax=Osmerus eperlanus TaxID=29151 RepID=UPI002E0DB12E
MYGREPRLSTEITGDLPHEVEVDGPGEGAFEDYLQTRANNDEEVFDKVRLNVEKAQEKQQEAYRRRTKNGTKRFKVLPGMEVLKKDERKRGRPGRTMDPDWPTKVTEVGDNNLVQLETLDGQPLKTRTPYASVKPLRKNECNLQHRFRASPPTEEAVSHPPEPVGSDDPELLSSEPEGDSLQATCIGLQEPVSHPTETVCLDGPELLCSELEEDCLQDVQDCDDVIITGVKRGLACPASLSRVEVLRATVLSPCCWLDDVAIDHSQALLQAQHPHVGGLYTTASLAFLSSVPASTQGFVQILNVCANHWVTVPRSACSGLMSSSREAAQIVGCLQSLTVSLSAEVRTQHAWSMNSPLCVTTSFPAFRLGT